MGLRELGDSVPTLEMTTQSRDSFGGGEATSTLPALTMVEGRHGQEAFSKKHAEVFPALSDLVRNITIWVWCDVRFLAYPRFQWFYRPGRGGVHGN